jgi:hypothetical protein
MWPGRIPINRARVDELRSRIKCRTDSAEVEASEVGHLAVEPRAMPVHFRQATEESGERTESREERVHELGFVADLQQRVVRTLPSDRRGPVAAARRGAERSRAMRWIDGEVVGQGQDPLMQRVELCVRERLSMFRPEEVGAPHGVDHQRATAEQRQRRPTARLQQVGEMVGRVSRRRDRFERERAHVDSVTVANTMVGYLKVRRSRREESGTERGELGASRDEVGMRMRVDCVGDAQPPFRRFLEFELGDAVGVDHQCGAVTEINEVRRVAEPLVDEGDNVGTHVETASRALARTCSLTKSSVMFSSALCSSAWWQSNRKSSPSSAPVNTTPHGHSKLLSAMPRLRQSPLVARQHDRSP